MPSLIEVYKEACSRLFNVDKDEINVRMLICHNNGLVSMSDFYLQKDQNIHDLQRFHSDFARFLSGEPVQYIIKETSFLNSSFFVDERVLIPRMETEEVVQYAIAKTKEIFKDKKVSVVDVCCGSGCMGISFAKTINVSDLYLIDILHDCIDVTNINLTKNKIDGHALCGDALKPCIENNILLDVIISNPPYILPNEPVDESVLRFEPSSALYTSERLDVYRSILEGVHKVSRNGCILIVFEISDLIRDSLDSLIEDLYPNATREFKKDINGHWRMCSIIIKME